MRTKPRLRDVLRPRNDHTEDFLELLILNGQLILVSEVDVE